MSLDSDTTSGPFLHLAVDTGHPFEKVIAAESAFHDLLRAVAREVTSRGGNPIRWQFVDASTNGVVRFRVTPEQIAKDLAPNAPTTIVDAVASGVVNLERAPDRPQYFTDQALDQAARLVALRQDVGSLGVMNGKVGSSITDTFRQHVDSLLGIQYYEEGSIEGTLEAVNVHDRSRFSVYDVLTRRPIKCNFGDRISIDQIAGALKKRVMIFGRIAYRANGVPISVTADELAGFPVDDELPRAADVRGLLR
jgi:hypothetical protein